MAVAMVMRVVENGEHVGSAYLKRGRTRKATQGTERNKGIRLTAFIVARALTLCMTSVTLVAMRLRCAIYVVVISAACVAGCRQPDGELPVQNGEVPNRLHDLERDLESVAAGEPDGPKDLADDLAVFAEGTEGVNAARTLAGSTSVVLVKRMLNEEALKQLTTVLWKTVASRDLSERQVDGLKDDMRGTLISIGVSQADSNTVADRVGQAQKAVTRRTRRWYERY